MRHLDDKAPSKPKALKAMWMPDGYYLFWTAPKAKKETDKAMYYVIYRFAPGERIDLDNPAHIIDITSQTLYKLPYEKGQQKFTYVVTALDRIQNESKGTRKKVRL